MACVKLCTPDDAIGFDVRAGQEKKVMWLDFSNPTQPREEN